MVDWEPIERTATMRKKQKKQQKQQWSVRLRCVVNKEVTCEGCTEEEARTNPWRYAVDEQEIDQSDWEVTSVEEG